MTEEAKIARDYLLEEVPQLLAKVEADAKPLWGIMTAQHMVEHMIVVMKMAIGRIQLPVVTPEEKLSKARESLISERPMPRSVPSPVGKNELQPLRSASIDEAREKLIAEINTYVSFAEENVGFISTHPYGGPLSTDDWLRFLKKHFIHHLTQFGVIPE